MVVIVTHDLRTPLSAIVTATSGSRSRIRESNAVASAPMRSLRDVTSIDPQAVNACSIRPYDADITWMTPEGKYRWSYVSELAVQ